MRARSRYTAKQAAFIRRIVLVLLLIGIAFILPTMVTMVSRVVLYPVVATQIWLRESTSSFPTYLRNKAALEDEIDRLQQELLLSRSTDATLQRLYEENNRLRQLLGDTGEDRIGAAVIARPSQLPYDFLQIDRGSEHGVLAGAPVYSGTDTVIGVVRQVDQQFSFVELFTTPGFTATAFVSDSNIVATLEGFGGGVARVRVPQGIPLRVGSLVYVPSIKPGVYGRLAYIESEPTQPEQYGYIVPDKAISSLQYVAVGRSVLEPPTAELIQSEVAAITATSLLVEGVNTVVSDLVDRTATTSDATTSPEEVVVESVALPPLETTNDE